MFRLAQNAFTGGELSEELYARADVAQFGVGLKTAYNVILHKQGGASARAGTQHVCTLPDSTKAARLTAFEFNVEQNYINVWGHNTLHVIKDGALSLEASKNVTGATQANPGVITINAHGWNNGDLVYASGLGGMTQLNGKYYLVANKTANTFELTTLYGAAVNTTGYGAWTAGGVFARAHKVATPYTADDDPEATAAQVFSLDLAQSNDEAYIAHLGIAPYMLTRTGHAAWTLTAQTFAATLAAPGSIAATTTVGTGAITYNYTVTALNDVTGEESIAGTANDCVNDLSADPTYKNTITWASVADASRYNVYKEEGGVFGYIGGTTALSFVDGPGGPAGGEITPDLTITPPLNYNPFDASANYPHAVEFHEARLVYAQTQTNPGAVFASQPTRYSNFNRSVPARSDDVVIARLLPGVNAIQGMASLGDSLFCATSNGEFTLQGTGVTPYLTPASVTPRMWSRRGADRLKPLVVGEAALYVQKQGRSIFAFGRLGSNSYSSTDLTVLAPHLFEGHYVRDWCYQQDPHGIVWIVRDDGMLLALTFLPEFEIFALSRVELGGVDVEVESCACISGADEDEVYFEVSRTINGSKRRHVERLKSLNWGTDVADYWGLDAAILYDGAAASTFSGLDHLEGQTVAALADGFLVTGLTVTGGSVTLSSLTFPAGASKVLIGILPPAWEIEPLPVAQPNQGGAPQGKRKRVVGVTLKLRRACGVFAGSNEDTLHPMKLRKGNVGAGLPTPPASGDYYVAFDPKHSKDGTFLIRGTAGLPARISALYPMLDEASAHVSLNDNA
jgi:hypothetical protein